MKTKMILGALALAALAGTAQAQFRVIFTDNTFGGGASNAIRSYDSVSNTVTTHATFGASARLADIKPVPGGFAFGDGPFPLQTPSTGGIYTVNNLFSNSPTINTVVSSNPFWGPIGMQYDSRSGRLLTVNNAAGGVSAEIDDADGLYTVNLGNGANTKVVDEINRPPLFAGTPRYQGGNYITADPQGSGDFFVVATTGGRFIQGGGPPPPPANQDVSSIIYRVSVSADGLTATTTELIDTFNINLRFPFEGDPNNLLPITDVRGITNIPGTDSLFVTDQLTDSIWRIDLDAGGAYSNITQIVTGLTNPEAIEYNPFNNTLVFAQGGNADLLSQVNLDGTGLTTLASGVAVRGITIIPAPSALALLGLGGLAVARRRR
ncbi:MAG: PEP-CTERM sorting domain-containing protein [Planctomycetota bacterium]|nr:PEP-CTERM sorting domain-containing protein [Planctomycetota bacterium]